MKPIVNLDELVIESCGTSIYQHRYGVICAKIGAKKMGYNLTIVAPGHRANFFHNHHANEEMFFIVEGSGMLRFGDREYPLRKHDVIACPPGGSDVAHQIINTSDDELRYLAISTKESVEISEFPDSKKISIMVGDYGASALSGSFKVESKVPYDDGEN